MNISLNYGDPPDRGFVKTHTTPPSMEIFLKFFKKKKSQNTPSKFFRVLMSINFFSNGNFYDFFLEISSELKKV